MTQIRKANAVQSIDYSKRCTIPVRDTWKDGRIVFLLDFYGVDEHQLALIQMGGKPDPNIGATPIRRAIQKRGLDPDRYQAWLFDLI